MCFRSIEADLQKMDVTSSELQKLHQQVTAIVQVNQSFMNAFSSHTQISLTKTCLLLVEKVLSIGDQGNHLFLLFFHLFLLFSLGIISIGEKGFF